MAMTVIAPERTEQARSTGPLAPVVPAPTRRVLLEIARAALGVATGRVAPRELGALVDRGVEPVIRAAVFVTLTESGELRGCIGTLDPDRRLEEAVAGTTVAAALRDPRFRPVEADEVPSLRVDISVLGTPVELGDLADFRPGLHGVIVEAGGRSALLLPEVATDQGWGVEAMLDAVCQKAGLARDAWTDARTRRLVFATTRFGGPAAEDAEAAEDADVGAAEDATRTG
jgi:AmmeMemoRadiSam system protein A